MDQKSKVIMRWLILIFLPSAAASSLLTITASPTTRQQTQRTSSATNRGYSTSSRDAFSSPIYFGIVSPAASTVLTTTVSRTIGPLTPSAPPVNVRGNPMSSSSIFVQWDQVLSQYQNGVILYYTVTYYRRHYSSSFPQRVVVAAPTTQTTLTGLNQGALYSISVSASNIRGDGPAASTSIATGCAREQEIHNGTNGEIIFYSYYYRSNQICSWEIMANKGEQVKLVLKKVDFYWCGFSCSCGQLEIQNGTYADGSTITRMCSTLQGKVTIHSHVGHGLRIRAVAYPSWSGDFRASYTVISSKDPLSDECFNYSFLNESDRAMTYTDRSLGNLSDSKLSGWYRFSGGAGTQMAEACPKMYSCSTNSSGWLNGTHPTVAEGIVQRKVCFSQRVSQFFTDCCNQAKTISVRNCGAFYVYRLDPSDFYSRYCGNGLPQAPECSNYELLNDCSRAVTYRSVLANCNNARKLLGWYRFGGEAGTQMADTCVLMRHCGARYPGWLSGGHPSVSDGAVLRKVCFTGKQGCCHYSTFISVRNCNGFYIYKLSPVVQYYYQCYYRYCSSYGFGLPTTSTAGSSAPPANVSGYNISSTRIFVQWDHVPAAHQNGAILYYTVTYRALPSGSVKTKRVSAPASQTTLTGLNKYTNYSITVFASTCKDGNVSAPIFIVTDEDTPSAYPANVRGNSTSSTSISLQWDQVPPQYQNGVILYYTVTYYKTYYSLIPQTVVVIAPKAQTTLTGLNQGTFYSITVSASTSKGRGPSKHIYIPTRCASEQEIVNGTNGEIVFHSYHYRYNQTCSWKIMANKREQIKLVLERVHFDRCGSSCSCGQLKIQNGTYADGSSVKRMCSTLRGKVTIYSHVGHGLRIRIVTHSWLWAEFRASYTVISSKDTVSDECSKYTSLNESTRAMTYAKSSLAGLSDSKLSGWYRFSGGAGTQMAEACRKMSSCSANSSGWLNGTHPTVAEGIVQRKVCFLQRASPSSNDCCNHSKNISVRNCGAFYVYRLDPSEYYSRYCGNGLSQAPECSNYKFLNDSSRAVTYNQSVLGNCYDTTKLLGWYRFGGEAGTQMADTCVKWRHCGASNPGWLSGGHPSVTDGAVLRKVCFTRYSVCCEDSTFISVRNCNGFYIYKLSPVVPYYYRCYYRYCSSYGFGLPTTSTTAKLSTTEKTAEPTTYKPTTTTSTTTTVVPTTLVKNVRITEGDDFTLNCTTEINTHEWSREEGKPDISEERTLKDGESISSSATVKDSGKYLCEIDNERYIFNVSVKVLVKVEMVISVLSYTFTPELQNKSSQVYKETEKNFTAEMDKVYNNTPGYVRTEVLNFTEGSVKVDFRVIIVFVATDPKNESTIIDKKATTGQTIIKEAENGLVSRLRVKPEVTVKTPPPEPRGVGFYDVKPDQIGIQWMVPDGFKSFDILSYEVEHWIFGKMDKRRKKLPAPEAKTEYSYRIQDLEPETTYMIRVAAINVHGSNYNEEKGQKTPPTTFPYWVIALIVLFAVAAIIGAVVCIRRRMIQRRNQQHEEEALGVMESRKKFESVLNQDEKIKGLNLKFTNASYRPTDVDWTEIPFESIKIMDELGSGAFGVVYKGEICRENGNIMPCAVKALKASATDEEIRDLYNELEIMSNIGSHPNLVNLLGACTKDGNLLVVLEIAENGSLIEFLKKIRSKNENYEGEGAVVRSGLSTDMKLSIALDVAKGMAHLASHRCIHRDLAARNVLLGKNYVAKVADYGMARDVYEQLMYKKETQGKLPVKWMAIESLETYVFTVESDVWSYGVLLWEMETGGLKPYPGLTTTELMAELKKGYRLEQPNGCSNEMYQVMMDCWHSNPSLRPTFDQLVERLEKMSVSS